MHTLWDATLQFGHLTSVLCHLFFEYCLHTDFLRKSLKSNPKPVPTSQLSDGQREGIYFWHFDLLFCYNWLPMQHFCFEWIIHICLDSSLYRLSKYDKSVCFLVCLFVCFFFGVRIIFYILTLLVSQRQIVECFVHSGLAVMNWHMCLLELLLIMSQYRSKFIPKPHASDQYSGILQ